MPDGPRYEDDFYAWTRYQAEVLRTLRTRDNRFDRDNVAEEMEELGRNYRDAVRSQVRRILVHFLKLAYSPARDPRLDWMDSVIDARAELVAVVAAGHRGGVGEALRRWPKTSGARSVKIRRARGCSRLAAGMPLYNRADPRGRLGSRIGRAGE